MTWPQHGVVTVWPIPAGDFTLGYNATFQQVSRASVNAAPLLTIFRKPTAFRPARVFRGRTGTWVAASYFGQRMVY
ncbi:MAG TPA: hypothetical protein VK638_22120 [Edaphobacter sp.]|nr:hypothetical protein [Edaphobacter sp.]